MIEPEFIELMQDLVPIAAATGRDRYGNQTYGAPVTYLARVQGTAQEIRDMMGNTQISSATVYAVPLAVSARGASGAFQRGTGWWVVAPTPWPQPKPPDQVTLPDGTQPLVLRVVTETDETGPHHLVIYT